MNESGIENSDPFLAISDYSDNEKAIEDINAFLNAPSSVVVKKKSNNQINNPSTSTLNTPSTNMNFTTTNNSNQIASPKKGSIQFESSVFELPSFESGDSSENVKNESKTNNTVKVINDFDISKNISDPSTPNLDRKKDVKRTPYPKRNLLSNQELINAFLASDNKNNDDNKENKQEKEKSKEEKTNKNLKKENEQKNSNEDKTQKDKNEDKKVRPNINTKNESTKKQKVMSPLNFLSKLDLDTTEVDFEKEEKQPIKKEPEKSFFHQNSHSTKDFQRQFIYVSPKTPVEAFEYSFLRYLEDASDDLRINFSEQFQTIVEQNFDFENKIQTFILNLNQELRKIIEDETSSLDLENNHFEYDMDYVSTFFQSLSSTLQNKSTELLNNNNNNNTENLKFTSNSPMVETNSSSKMLDLSDVTINADLIQSLSSSFVSNSKTILSDLQNSFTELSEVQLNFKQAEEVRIKDVYRQKILTRIDLEAQEHQLSIECDYFNKKLENLKRKNNFDLNEDLFSSNFSINETLSRKFEDLPNIDELNDEIDDIIIGLKNFDTKKVTTPLKSFSQNVKPLSGEILFLNSQLSGKTRMVSRSLPLGNKNNLTLSAAQPSISMGMNHPFYRSNFDFSEYSYQNQISNDFNGLKVNTDYSFIGNSKVANNVRERLANIKQLREDQIAEVNELISDNQ